MLQLVHKEEEMYMAYESRFYVVEKGFRASESTRDTAGDDKVWAEKIAMFDLCSVPEVSDIIRKNYKPTDCYIYEGNEMIVEDMYGDLLIEVPLKDMIDILEKVTVESTYRRFQPFLMMLKGFNPKQWVNIAVLHYGH